MKLFDTHVHLDGKKFRKDANETFERAVDAGVERMCNVFLSPEEYENMPSFMKESDRFVYSIGIHPHYSDNAPKHVLDQIEWHAANDPKVKAIGEIGLDYYRDLKPRSVQKETFVRQINIAKRLDLPMIIHARDAEVEAMKMLRKHGCDDHDVLFHAWCGDEEATRSLCTSRNWLIGVGGSITYSQNAALQASIKNVPIGKIVLETDCPWLGPGAKRKQRNEPANVNDVAEFVAKLRGEETEVVARAAYDNACVFFGLPK